MLRRFIFSALCAAAALGAWSFAADEARAFDHGPVQCLPKQYLAPDLFYNFYVPPTCGGIGAQMYIAPHPTPPWVGHTYYTYQPMFPHEWLYKHKRTYYTYYNYNRGLTRTHIRWW